MKKMIVIIVIFLMLCSACKDENKMKDQILNLNDLPTIEIKSDDTFTEKHVDHYIEAFIKTQPKYLLKNVNKIVICNNKQFKKYAKGKSSIAFSNPNNMNIYSKSKIYKEALTHELIHILDYTKGYHCYSNDVSFQTLYETYKGTFHLIEDKENEYGENKLKDYDNYFNSMQEEFFAETAQLYVNNPNYLKSVCEPIYDYLDNLFQEII